MALIHSVLTRLAGQEAFEKGERLYAQHAVENLHVEQSHTNALVKDEVTHFVRLSPLVDSYEGSCTCPVSEGFDFCAHCVATALALDARVQHLSALKNGPPAMRLEAFVEELPEQVAKAHLLKIIQGEKHLSDKWLVYADTASGNVKVSDIKKVITRALPLSAISQHAKVEQYFLHAQKHLQVVQDVLPLLPANRAFQVAEYGLFRLDKVLSKIDDVSAYRLPLLARLQSLYYGSFKRLAWNIEDKTQFLLALYNTPYSHFELSDIPQQGIADDDAPLQDHFHQALIKQLQKQGIKVRKSTGGVDSTYRDMLGSLAEYFATRGDIRKALLWLEKGADNIQGYRTLIDFCFEHDQYQKIKGYLDQGLKICKSPYEHRTMDVLAHKYKVLTSE